MMGRVVRGVDGLAMLAMCELSFLTDFASSLDTSRFNDSWIIDGLLVSALLKITFMSDDISCPRFEVLSHDALVWAFKDGLRGSTM